MTTYDAAGPAPLQWVRRLAQNDGLDAPARALDALADRVAPGRAMPVLRGDWLGHALHPLLTDVPLGAWLAAGLLDIFGGKRSRAAATRLVGLGLIATLPTAASGLAEHRSNEDTASRRVTTVHAVGNGIVATCYVQSWRCRRRGSHLTGVLWGFAGGTLAWGTRYLGGHLSLVSPVANGARGETPGVEGGRGGAVRSRS